MVSKSAEHFIELTRQQAPDSIEEKSGRAGQLTTVEEHLN